MARKHWLNDALGRACADAEPPPPPPPPPGAARGVRRAGALASAPATAPPRTRARGEPSDEYGARGAVKDEYGARGAVKDEYFDGELSPRRRAAFAGAKALPWPAAAAST